MTRAAALALLLALAGCGERPAPRERTAPADPAAALALAAPLLTDPDLASRSSRFAVLSDPGPIDASLPPDDFAVATIAAARAEAARLAAAQPIEGLPTVACPVCAAATLAGRAAALGAECGKGVVEDFAWALRLPGELPIYPRSHLREAAGAAGGACPLRAASFTAPVPPGEALAFYAAVAARSGFALRRARTDGGGEGLLGRRGAERIAVIARPAPAAAAIVDLVATGAP